MSEVEDKQQIRELRRVNRLILQAAGDGIYGIDKHGLGTFTNAAATAMTGWKEDDIVGHMSHDVWHHSHTDGSHYPKADCPIYAAAREGLQRQVDSEVFWRKDGSSFPVEYTSTPIFEGDEIVGAVAVFRDITERKLAEAELLEVHEEVRRLKDQLQAENRYLREEIETTHNFSEIIGNDPALIATLTEIEQVAPTDATVLINGESGTGKELIARALHNLSDRNDRPLIKINCAALTDNLVESELFGHEKGAFTGAVKARAGRFELADGGTLFLDEVAELPAETQTKLLRVLQEQEFERVGGSEPIKVNVRVIAASHRDLQAMVENGDFRLDLFYRLNVFPVRIPALRERVADIPLLVDCMLQKASKRLGKTITGVSEATMQQLMQYQWPGNIRELQNVIERAAILARESIIEVDNALLPAATAAQRSQPPTKTLHAIEKQHITAVLEQTRWSIAGPTGAAVILDMHPNTLRSRMAKLDISKPLV